VQTKLKGELNAVSWTRPDSIHLTLHFLGNVQASQFDALKDAFERSVAGHRIFSLEVAGIGTFGNRVIWAGVRGDVENLMKLEESVRKATAGFGSNDETRAFKAHLTIGRLRTPQRGVSMKLRRFAEENFGPWRVTEVHLYQSQLSSQGARHTVLATAPLMESGGSRR
jgi:2'-5' RNA ligase